MQGSVPRDGTKLKKRSQANTNYRYDSVSQILLIDSYYLTFVLEGSCPSVVILQLEPRSVLLVWDEVLTSHCMQTAS